MAGDLTVVRIPGDVTATFEDGEIVAIVFCPHGSNAGYFGPSAEVVEGDDSLNVEDTIAPFWRAVQRYLEDGSERIEWQE